MEREVRRARHQIAHLLERTGLSGPRLYVAAVGVSGIFLALSYVIATFPSNKRRR
jgi:hypothetical protein